jgi:uncharacterized phage protein (TIGR01671 family)
MREILFRAWNIEEKRYIHPDKEGWYNEVFIGSNGYYQNVQLTALLKSDKVIVEQYTGLKDKNGMRIFEGDFLKIKANEYYSNENILLEEDCELCGNVIKYNGCFALRDGNMDDVLFWDLFEYDFDLEIIGNIHEEVKI